MERPAVLNLGAGLDEALCVECETTSKPFRVRVRASHHEHMLDVAGFAHSSLTVAQENPLKMRVAFERFDPVQAISVILGLVSILEIKYRDMVLARQGPLTARQTCLALSARKTAACPAEFPPPTTATSSSRQTVASIWVAP